MIKNKYVRTVILTLATAFSIFFSPIGESEASAADFTSKELYNTATDLLGVPYVYGGTSTSGFDCSGFTRHVMKELGVSLPRTSKSMYQEGESVEKGDLQPGDLVFFNTFGKGVSHVGIYIGEDKFIHSQTNKGVSITDIDDKWYWGSRFVGAKRVASVSTAS